MAVPFDAEDDFDHGGGDNDGNDSSEVDRVGTGHSGGGDRGGAGHSNGGDRGGAGHSGGTIEETLSELEYVSQVRGVHVIHQSWFSNGSDGDGPLEPEAIQQHAVSVESSCSEMETENNDHVDLESNGRQARDDATDGHGDDSFQANGDQEMLSGEDERSTSCDRSGDGAEKAVAA